VQVISFSEVENEVFMILIIAEPTALNKNPIVHVLSNEQIQK
jgi:hypothetical protein